MTTAIELRNGTGITIDYNAVLKTLNLNPADPKVQAALLICDKYGLDPILKHMVLINGTPYVTRDGYIHVAQMSERLDGIVVEDEQETGSHWVAKVSVYRKDMSHPFTYVGRYPKDGGNKKFGPEMAITRAETHALRRAFAVTGVASYEEVFEAESRDNPEPQPRNAAFAVGHQIDAAKNPDLATGEIKSRRRQPPAQPAQRPEGYPPRPEELADKAVSDEQLKLVRALKPHQQEWMHAQAKGRVPAIGGPHYTKEHAELVAAWVIVAAGIPEPEDPGRPFDDEPEDAA